MLRRTFSLLYVDCSDVGVVVVAVEDVTVVGFITYCWTMFPLAARYITSHNLTFLLLFAI